MKIKQKAKKEPRLTDGQKKFHVRHNNGDEQTVVAHSEDEARNKAMRRRYGPPGGPVTPYDYLGSGLSVTEVR